MRIAIRLLSCVVIASAAVTVWTRGALVFVLGPQLTAVCLWIAAGGSVCAVITLLLVRKPNRLQPRRPPEPLPARAGRRDHYHDYGYGYDYDYDYDYDQAGAPMTGRQTRHAHRPP